MGVIGNFALGKLCYISCLTSVKDAEDVMTFPEEKVTLSA